MKAKTKNSAIKILVTMSLTPGVGAKCSCLFQGELLVIGVLRVSAAPNLSSFCPAAQWRTRIAFELELTRQVFRLLLDSEAKMNDVTVLDDVVFALKSELAGLFTLRLTAQNNKVIVSNHLGTDKSALDVAMNLPGSFARDGSLSDRPGANLVFARRKEAYQIQQSVRRPDKSLAGRFLNANLLQKCLAIAFIQLRDLHLNLPR